MIHKAVRSVFLMALWLIPVCAGQGGESARPVVGRDNHCEENRSFFDYIHVEAGNEPLIIIARLGEREQGRALNWRRLHNIREYFTYFREIPEQNIIVAEGEPIKGRGRVEVYLRGQLVAVFIVGPNQDLSGVECEAVKNIRFYPWRKKSPLPVPKLSLSVPE